MATITQLRAQAKQAYQGGKGDRRLKGYSKMKKVDLERILGGSDSGATERRAAKSQGNLEKRVGSAVASTNADIGQNEKLKGQILKAIKKDVDAARKQNPNISKEELRKVAAKSLGQELKYIRGEEKRPTEQPKAKAKPKAEPKPKVESKPKSEPKAKPETKSKPEVKAKTQSPENPQPKPEPQSKTKSPTPDTSNSKAIAKATFDYLESDAAKRNGDQGVIRRLDDMARMVQNDSWKRQGDSEHASTINAMMARLDNRAISTELNKASAPLMKEAYNQMSDKGRDKLAEIYWDKHSGDIPDAQNKEYGEIVKDIRSRARKLAAKGDLPDYTGEFTDLSVFEPKPKTEAPKLPPAPPNPSTPSPIRNKEHLAKTVNIEKLPGESASAFVMRRMQVLKEGEKLAREAADKLPNPPKTKPDEWRNLQASQDEKDDFITSLYSSKRDSSLKPSPSQVMEWRKKAKNPPSFEEVAAMNLYTKAEYTKINRQLRGTEDSNHPSITDRDARVIASAMRSLPDHKGEVYRGFGLRNGLTLDDVQAMYRPGSTVTETAFTSTTSNKDGANEAWGKHPVQFTIKSKTGKNVTEYSHSPHENEVLFPPHTKFKVSKAERKGDKLIIHMEEA